METKLAAEVRRRRGDRSLPVTARDVGVSHPTILRLEQGGRPSLDTAVKLARWLGWTVEQVVEAAEQPA